MSTLGLWLVTVIVVGYYAYGLPYETWYFELVIDTKTMANSYWTMVFVI